MLVKGKTGVNQELDLVEGKDNPSINFTKSKSDLKSDFIIKRKKKITILQKLLNQSVMI